MPPRCEIHACGRLPCSPGDRLDLLMRALPSTSSGFCSCVRVSRGSTTCRSCIHRSLHRCSQTCGQAGAGSDSAHLCVLRRASRS